MKIGLFTDSDVFAGTERHMIDLACALREYACSVTLLCPKSGALAERGRELSLHVEAVEKGHAVNFSVVKQLAVLFRQKRFDLVHAHNGRTAIHTALATIAAPRCCLVATQHYIAPARASRTGLNALMMNCAHRWAERRTSHVIAISEAVRVAALSRGEIEPRKITVVANGISDPLRLPLREPASVRAELGIPEETVVFTTVARLENEKGLSTLVAAMAIVLRQNPRVVCLILGEGSLRLALNQQIVMGGLGSAIRLLGFRKDVFSIVNASDFCVLPSPNEPFGLAVVEAMSLSKAVIAAKAGGPAEILHDGEDGILCPASDPESFAQAIGRLTKDPALRERMGNRGRARYLERFTAERMGIDIIKIYKTVLARLPQLEA